MGDGGSICIGCGLCCDGTLHGFATVGEDDEAAAAAVGLTVVEEQGERRFAQPCPHFSCGTCAVYDDRPSVCRAYRCALLKKVDAGSISPAHARERIERATKLRAAIHAAAPQANTPAARSALELQLESDLPSLAGEQKLRAAKLLLDLLALETLLDSSFRKQKTAESDKAAADKP